MLSLGTNGPHCFELGVVELDTWDLCLHSLTHLFGTAMRSCAGVRAGMFVRSSKALCPELEIVPYDFPAYEQVISCIYSSSLLHTQSNDSLVLSLRNQAVLAICQGL